MKRSSGIVKYVVMVVLILVIGGAGFVLLSPKFEMNAPKIEINTKSEFWNLRDEIPVKITDDSGVKYYRVVFNDGTKDTELVSEVLTEEKKEVLINAKPPKMDMFFKGKEVTLKIQAVDSSKWNFFEGNNAYKEIKFKIDKAKPIANVVRNTLAIAKGGSAIAIVEVRDENLKDTYITFNGVERFELIPFHKEGYFISLIAWPVTIDEFQRVSLVATDFAGNETVTKIPLYIRDLPIKDDDIKISDEFIENVSKNVLTQSGEPTPDGLVESFIYENNILREKNVKTLKEITSKAMSKDMIDNFSISIFKRLSGSRQAAGFAERRHYYHNDVKIDDAWHLGMDWASIKEAEVFASNPGKVIFNEYLGIYGNTIIIDHGMGLSTLYAHTSSSNVRLGDDIVADQKIANTGSTGAVLGDHLHFGVLVQGIEVNPAEWMDRNWIKTRITDIIEDAKKAIDTK